MSDANQDNSSEAQTQSVRKTLGILQAGRAPEEIIDRYPDYNQLFVNLLGEDSFNYRHWAVLDNVFPDSVDDADAWLITGSRHGAYEPHTWIPPLEQLIKEIYAKGAPMVGICFGHQIIAQALGGKVEKFSGGWSVGRVDYKLDPNVFRGCQEQNTPLMAFHQDQVLQLPEGAANAGSSNICQHAAIVYDSRILTIQPHPEFDQTFVGGLLEARGDVLPKDVLELANSTLHEPISQDPIAQTFREFLNRDRIDNHVDKAG
ncbi:MAG: type 1 glutamine amidotransferase [Granulosicoccus sp.]